MCAQSLDKRSTQLISGALIPHSVVYLRVSLPSPKLVSELLATRSKRDLQRVDFGLLDDNAAAVAGRLVSTDPRKQWECVAQFAPAAAFAFCQAVADGVTSTASSLTDLDVKVHQGESLALLELLAATPGLTNFRLRAFEVFTPVCPRGAVLR
jgi:hypothetical protein